MVGECICNVSKVKKFIGEKNGIMYKEIKDMFIKKGV
jgi:hypothetical protein